MRKKQGKVISVTGDLGSGKSSIAHLLADRLGWLYYSTGLAQRKIAEELGITTTELNQLSSSNPLIDQKVDAVFRNPPWGNKSCVVDSRLAFYFLPNSFKVCLTVDPKVGAKRIFYDKKRTSEKKYTSVKQAETACIQRRALEVSRFKEKYNLDITNSQNFDLVVDTTNLTLEQVCNEIINHFGSK